MSEENKELLLKRAKSFAWRAGGQLAALTLAFVAENLQLLDLPGWAVVVAGLLISEGTKALNQKA